MKMHSRRRRAAFTLIELLASAVLAAMMMAALLSIVWSAVQESGQLSRSGAGRFSFTRMADQLRSDFHNARGMALDGRGVTLHGFLGRDPITKQPLLVPGRVRYQAGRIGDRGVLTRTDGDSAEVVWYGFSALQIQSLLEPDPESELLPLPETGGLPPMPLSFQVTVLDDQGQVLWREVIHHRDS